MGRRVGMWVLGHSDSRPAAMPPVRAAREEPAANAPSGDSSARLTRRRTPRDTCGVCAVEGVILWYLIGLRRRIISNGYFLFRQIHGIQEPEPSPPRRARQQRWSRLQPRSSTCARRQPGVMFFQQSPRCGMASKRAPFLPVPVRTPCRKAEDEGRIVRAKRPPHHFPVPARFSRAEDRGRGNHI